MQRTVHLSLHGYPAALVDGQERRLALRRGWALLAVLALDRPRAARDHLCAMLWPEAPPSTARARLRRLVHELNSQLGVALVRGSADALWLAHDDLALSCDVAAVRQAAQRTEAGDDAALLLAPAAADILASFALDSDEFDEWLAVQRNEHRRLLMRALKRLAQQHAPQGDARLAIAAADRALALDPFVEAPYVAKIQALSRQGDGAAVEATYFACSEALRQEFGVRPSPLLEDAYARSRGTLARREGDGGDDIALPEVRYADTGRGAVAYASVGEGPSTLLVVPGLLSNIEVAFEEPRVRRCVAWLARRMRVVLIDRRGTGLSERMNVAPDLAAGVDDMVAVLDALGVDSAWVLGAAVGGTVAIEFAAVEAARTAGVILYACHARGSRAPDYPWALTDRALERWLDQLSRHWGKPTSLAAFAPSAADDAQVQRWWARMLRQSVTPQGMESLLRAFHRMDVRHRLPQVSAPALVIHRLGDRIVRHGAPEYLAQRLPNARLVTLPGDDHWWWHGDAQSVLDAIGGFVEDTAD